MRGGYPSRSIGRPDSKRPLPGEEQPLEEVVDVDGKKTTRVRMPLKVAARQRDGAANIDVNAQHLIDPAQFLKIYTSKLINHAQDSTGLAVRLYIRVPFI